MGKLTKGCFIGLGNMLWILCVFTQVTTAEELRFNVSAKTWYTQWTETVGGISGEFESDFVLMYGPVVGVTYGQWFAGVAYTQGDFSFSEAVEEICACDADFHAERRDADIVFGYKLHPYFNPLLGYKQADIEGTIKFGSSSEQVNVSFRGPFIGVSANYPIGQSPWVVLGSLNYLLMDYEDGVVTEEAPGFSYELSGLYRFHNMPVSVTAGYKYQKFETNETGDNVLDEFSGLLFGATYAF